MTQGEPIRTPEFLGPIDNNDDDNNEAASAWSDVAPAVGEPTSLPTDGELSADDEVEDGPRRRAGALLPRWLMQDGAAFLISMNTHLVLLIVLALWTLPAIIDDMRRPLLVSTDEQELVETLETVFLDDRTDPATDMVYTPSAASLTPELNSVVSNRDVERGRNIVEDTTLGRPIMSGESFADDMVDMRKMLGQKTKETLGDARVVVDDYQQVMDRITAEILDMLKDSKVLVVWCFDQSTSMKDDQQEIRQRIQRVYDELGLSEKASGDLLTTAVTSFGQGFQVHTKRPTNNVKLIRRAIDAVPIDPSGLEMTCRAVSMSIAGHAKYARGSKRQMALILVTDESGELEANIKFLESAIANAKSAGCKVYILGREAVFGYPYAHMRWRHPQTGHVHRLSINRGPETGFVESLQTSCFRPRHDSHPSGYGPYEQSRLAEQTGGIFFMLPTIEDNLVQVQNETRRYRLDAMEPYRPDLRSRQEIFYDRDKSPLQTAIWSIINGLNPYDPETAKIINLRMHYPLRPDKFITQARQEQAKAKIYISYIERALKTLDEMKQHRDDEYQPRWKANYDLLYAQLLAYEARIYEYGAALDKFIANPPQVPLQKPFNFTLTGWAVRYQKETVADDVTAETIAKAKQRFAQVEEDHPDTPWSVRADWEAKRSYGVGLVPVYHRPYNGPPRTHGGPRIPVPKL